MWQVKKYGIPKSVICGRLPDFFMQPSQRRSLAVGTAHRNFVSKNPQARIVLRINKESAILYQLKIIFACKDLRLSRNKIVLKVRKFD